MSKLHEVEQPLSYGQVSKVVREVNAVARKERKSVSNWPEGVTYTCT